MAIFKSKIIRVVLFILGIVIILGGVVYLFRIQIVTHFIPSVNQIGEIQIHIRNDSAIVSSDLLVTNKSSLKVKIDSIKYKVSLNEITYLKNDKYLGIDLPGYGTDTLNFSLTIPYKSILKDLRAERKLEDSTTYSIEVSLVYSTILGKVEIPINKEAKFKIPQPPEFSIVDITYQKIRRKYIFAEAKIRIINHSNVDLLITRIDYSMIILEQGNLKGSLDKSTKIEPKSTSIISLPIEIGMDNIGKTVYKVIMNKDKFNYTLHINALMEVKNPLQETFHIQISKNGIMELLK